MMNMQPDKDNGEKKNMPQRIGGLHHVWDGDTISQAEMDAIEKASKKKAGNESSGKSANL